MRFHRSVSAICIGTSILLGSVAFAQSQRAIILGRVSDTSGSVVADAAVTVFDTDTNVARKTVSNSKGYFEVPGLYPGTYRVEASASGFKHAVINAIPVTGAQRAEVDVVLEVGAVNESVTVTAQQNLLDVADAAVSTVFDHRKLQDLPTGMGNVTLLFMFSTAGDSAGGLTASPSERQTGWLTNFNGSPKGTAEFTLDGAPNSQNGNTGLGGGPAFLPSAEVVEEVRISTNTFDASLGHTGGVTVDVSLKSGGNEYHGSPYGYWRMPGLNANSWSGNRAGQKRPDFNFDRYGFNGGGPITIPKIYNGKNRTFFYYGYEKWDSLNITNPVNGTVPTAEQRTGDLSSMLRIGAQYQVYDPNTGVATADGRIQRQPFAGNIIPTSRLDPNSQLMMKLWPLPNTAGTRDGQFNFNYFTAPIPRRFWSSTLRLDHELTRSHKLSGRVLWSDLHQPAATLFGDTDPSKASGFSGLNRDVAINDVWVIRPTFIADFRASVLRAHFDETPMGLGIPYSSIGLGGIAKVADSAVAGLPSVVAVGYRLSDTAPTDGPVSNSAPRQVINEVRSAAAHFTKIRGNHSMKFGADYRGYFYNTGYGDTAYGANFTGAYTTGPFNNSPMAPLGGSLADMLLGRFNFSYVDQRPTASNYSSFWGFYLQDDWKVTPRLTLNLGLRYEREGPPTERYDRAIADFASNVDNPIGAAAKANYAASPIPEIAAGQFQVKGGMVFAGVNGAPRTIYDAQNKNFAPRFGIAYRLNNRTALRAGYGIFFLPNGQRLFGGDGFVPGFRVTTFSYGTRDGGLTFPGSFNNLFPNGLDPSPGSSLGMLTSLGTSLALTSGGGSRSRPYAYNQSWQFEIQRTIGSSTKLQVRYAGNRTIKMPIIRDVNALPNSYLSTSGERDPAAISRLTQLVPSPFFGIANAGATLSTGRTIARQQLLLPFPEFASVQVYDSNGWSTYHALQVEINRRLAKGLTVQGNFVFSKAMQGINFLNAGDPVPEKVIGPIDRPRVYRAMGLYELPFGRGHSLNPGGFASRLVSGWQLQGFWYFQSGVPLCVGTGSPTCDFGNVLFRGDIKNLAVDNITAQRMFNIDAGFERDAAKQLASNVRTFPVRFSGLRMQHSTDTSVSALKNFAVTERLKFQFRFEAYNAFNQHFFTSAPVTTPTSTAFGQTTASTGPRAVQLGLKMTF